MHALSLCVWKKKMDKYIEYTDEYLNTREKRWMNKYMKIDEYKFCSYTLPSVTFAGKVYGVQDPEHGGEL